MQTITISSYKNSLLTLLALFTIGMVNGQQTSAPATASLALGASYGFAPTLTLRGGETSGTFYSLYGDATINDQWVGRAQYSSLVSLGDGLGEVIERGFALNGSLGYNISMKSNPSVHLPIMATIGYASIKGVNGFSDPGMQVGITVAPKYFIQDKVILNVTGRFLKGVSVDGGQELGQTDISFGIMYRIM